METTLDLHGYGHKDVFQKVDKFIGQHIVKGTMTVEIITGYSSKMKDIVNEVLQDYDLESTESWMNNGKLTIKMT